MSAKVTLLKNIMQQLKLKVLKIAFYSGVPLINNLEISFPHQIMLSCQY